MTTIRPSEAALAVALLMGAPALASDPGLPTEQVTEETGHGTGASQACQIRIGDVTGSLTLQGPLCGEAQEPRRMNQTLEALLMRNQGWM